MVQPGPLKKPSDFKLGDFSIDAPRPIKVVVIGAGYSGGSSSYPKLSMASDLKNRHRFWYTVNQSAYCVLK